MCHKSPAKVLRSVLRIIRFIERKPSALSALSVTVLPPVVIAPSEKSLSFSLPTNTNVFPIPKTLSLSKGDCISVPPTLKSKQPLSYDNVCFTDIPPDPFPCMYCMLVAPKPNLPRTPTSPVPLCSICDRPVDDRFEPHICCDMVMHQHCLGHHYCEGWE